MARLLPCLWLLAAILYTVVALFLVQPFAGDDRPLASVVPNETVRAKQPARAAAEALPAKTSSIDAEPAAPGQAAPHESLDVAVVGALPPLPRPERGTVVRRHNAWVQIARYTTVVRAAPSASAPVLSAYAAGRPFRVIDQEAGFIRVQDLGSGQLGWIQEASLAPFTGGYRQREIMIASPQVTAAPQVLALAPQVAATPVVMPVPVVSAEPRSAPKPWKRTSRPFALAPMEQPAEVDTKPEPKPQGRLLRRVAGGDSLDNIMHRALSGY